MSNLSSGKKSTGLCSISSNSKYSTEFADEILLDNYSKGVTFRTSGDLLRLTYNGLLAKSGANQIVAAVGFGSNQNWQDTKFYTMNNIGGQTFEVLLPVNESQNINVAFKDAADNWDNNSGSNYKFYTQ